MTSFVHDYGKCNSGILFIKAVPNEEECRSGVAFGSSEGLFYKTLLASKFRLSFEEDCAAMCFLSEVDEAHLDKYEKIKFTEELKKSIEDRILRYNPQLIFAIGNIPIKYLFPKNLAPVEEFRLHGRLFKQLDRNLKVGCLINDVKSPDFKRVAARDVGIIFDKFLNEDPLITNFDFDKENILVDDCNTAIELLEYFSTSGKPTVFDYETNTGEKFADGVKLYTIALSDDVSTGYCIPLDYPGVWNEFERAFVSDGIKKFVKSDTPKIIQNFCFEQTCTKLYFDCDVNNFIYDTMLGYHIVDGRERICSLDFQTFELFGKTHKGMVDIYNLVNEPLEKVSKYNCLDVRTTLLLYLLRKKYSDNNPWIDRPNKFFMPMLKMAADMEFKGIKIDVDLLNKQTKEAADRLKELNAYIYEESEVAKIFKEKYPDKEFDVGKPAVQGLIFYDICNVTPTVFTAKAQRPSTAAPVIDKILESSEFPEKHKKFAEYFLELKKYEKMDSTYLSTYKDLSEFSVNNLIHPTFALHTTKTYRSSYYNPNLQNIPKRTEFGKTIRKVFIPFNDWFLDGDFAGAELRVIGMYSNDDRLKYEILNGVDLHAYWASRVLEKKEYNINKAERADAKTHFVFATFYKGWFGTMAAHYGRKPEDMEKLVNELYARYPGVKKWQDDAIRFYNTHGYVETFLGFRRYGPLKPRQICNTPIQGTSFHLLLKGMYDTYLYMLEKKLRSRGIILQIHDETLFDCIDSELQEIAEVATKNFTTIHYDWQHGIPMDVEWGIGKNFCDLEDV